MVKTVKLFVEGGGDSKLLRTECRAAFSSFLQKADLSGYMPRIVASGSRNTAYSDYCTAINNGESAALLVDSEAEVLISKEDAKYEVGNPRTWNPWYHLKHRRGRTGESADHWEKPIGASEEDCHLMVQSMESWFLADINALKSFYGSTFNESGLPNRSDIEYISKDAVLTCLHTVSRNTRKGSYDKGAHSFGILASIDPNKVTALSPWASRFVLLLTAKMHSVR